MRQPIVHLLLSACFILPAVPALAADGEAKTPRWVVRDAQTTSRPVIYRGQKAIEMNLQLRLSAAAVSEACPHQPASRRTAEQRIAPPIATELAYGGTTNSFNGPSLFDDSELDYINGITRADAKAAGRADSQLVPTPVTSEVFAPSGLGIVGTIELDVVGVPVATGPSPSPARSFSTPINVKVRPQQAKGGGEVIYRGISRATITPDLEAACKDVRRGQSCTVGYTLIMERTDGHLEDIVGLRVDVNSTLAGDGRRAPRGVRVHSRLAR